MRKRFFSGGSSFQANYFSNEIIPLLLKATFNGCDCIIFMYTEGVEKNGLLKLSIHTNLFA